MERLDSSREPKALDVSGDRQTGPEQWQPGTKHGDSSAIPKTTRGTRAGQTGTETEGT